MPKTAIADCLSRHQKLSINSYKGHIKEASKQGVISHFDFSYNHRGKPYSYKLQITTTPCHYGGVRYWWQCPKCAKRVGLYVCRQCLGVITIARHNIPTSDLITVWRVLESV